MEITIKAILGAAIVIALHFLSKSSNFYLAALVVLFPTFSLIAYFMIGTERSMEDVKETAIFGIYAIIPYAAFVLSVIFFSSRLKLFTTLVLSTVVWCVFALALTLLWRKFS